MGKAFLLAVFLMWACGSNQKYEVIERTGKDVRIYCGPGTHVEVE